MSYKSFFIIEGITDVCLFGIFLSAASKAFKFTFWKFTVDVNSLNIKISQTAYTLLIAISVGFLFTIFWTSGIVARKWVKERTLN